MKIIILVLVTLGCNTFSKKETPVVPKEIVKKTIVHSPLRNTVREVLNHIRTFSRKNTLKSFTDKDKTFRYDETLKYQNKEIRIVLEVVNKRTYYVYHCVVTVEGFNKIKKLEVTSKNPADVVLYIKNSIK